ncbi:MAG: sigma-70 family RNA polymerase sigma factor [Bacteroidales bacterium]|nr:sigma-70 family RNA polymerase sigma factor [Bacteroidales bacterium]
MFKRRNNKEDELRRQFLDDFSKINKVIYRMCLFYSNSNKRDAEDLFQDITLILYDNHKKYNQSRNFFSWAYKVSLNYIISNHRRVANKYFRPMRLLEDVEYMDWEYEDNQEARVVLMYSLIEKLSDEDKKLVKLYLEGIKRKDIAIILGISTEQVSQRLYRIKLKLKTMADGYDEQ